MENITKDHLKILLSFLFVFLSSGVCAQNGIYFKWWSHAECYEYDDRGKIPLEGIADETCFKVCENNLSEYPSVRG